MITVIEDILRQDYDTLIRDEAGSIVYEKRLKQVAENLLHHEELQSERFTTYDEFLNAILRGCAIYKLPDRCNPKYRYVNDVLTKPIWTSWLPSNRVFISAGTGRGKNTFIKMELLKHIGDARAVIFENRESLMQQQITDIVDEIDHDALKYQDFSDEGMVTFGSRKNIMIISYQTAAVKCALGDSRFLDFCNTAKYLIFDEAHYMLDDAPFNKGINFFINTFLNPSFFPNAIRLFLSGSMEEFYSFTQCLVPFSSEPINLYNEKELFDKKPNHELTRLIEAKTNGIDVLSMPTDYSYICPYRYQELTDICDQIQASDGDEKWLVFVKSINDGLKLYYALKEVLGNSVRFLNAGNKNDHENKDTYDQLVKACKFDCRVLIATTVIYNGINVKDSAVKHLVLPFSTVPILKQLIGRKRMEEGEHVNVYFQDVKLDVLKRRYMNCVKDYLELMQIRSSLPIRSMLQLNGLTDSTPSKFYYLLPQQVIGSDGKPVTVLMPALNIPVIYKLFCDTCYYIFLLQQYQRDENTDLIKILLKHLDVEEKEIQLVEPSSTEPIGDQKINQKISELEDYLQQLIAKPIKAPDANGSFEDFLKLKELINEAYKSIHGGKSIDTQWKNKTRFQTDQKVKDFLAEIALPYQIENMSVNGVRTITVKRL